MSCLPPLGRGGAAPVRWVLMGPSLLLGQRERRGAGEWGKFSPLHLSPRQDYRMYLFPIAAAVNYPNLEA